MPVNSSDGLALTVCNSVNVLGTSVQATFGISSGPPGSCVSACRGRTSVTPPRFCTSTGCPPPSDTPLAFHWTGSSMYVPLSIGSPITVNRANIVWSFLSCTTIVAPGEMMINPR